MIKIIMKCDSKINFLKFLLVILPLRPCKIIGANEKRRSTAADDVSDV